MKKLAEIQRNLKAPKNQTNSFGKYKYRSCEDILEGVKTLLGDAVLTMSDKIILVGDRYYVEATATITADGESVSVTSSARESENKKGMDAAQITGASSSYARKYALNGLFCIDDTRDSDSKDNSKVEPIKYISQIQINQLQDADINDILPTMLHQANIKNVESIPEERFDRMYDYVIGNGGK